MSTNVNNSYGLTNDSYSLTNENKPKRKRVKQAVQPSRKPRTAKRESDTNNDEPKTGRIKKPRKEKEVSHSYRTPPTQRELDERRIRSGLKRWEEKGYKVDTEYAFSFYSDKELERLSPRQIVTDYGMYTSGQKTVSAKSHFEYLQAIQKEKTRLRQQLNRYQHNGFIIDATKELSQYTLEELKQLKPKDILLKSASYVSEGTYGEVISAKDFYSNRRAILDVILEQQTEQHISQLEDFDIEKDFDIDEYDKQNERTPEERQEYKQQYRDLTAKASRERILRRKQGRKTMDFTDTYSTMVYNWLGSIDMLPPKVRNIVYKHWDNFVNTHGYSKAIEMVAQAIENNEIPDFEWLKNQPSDVVEQEVSETFDMFLQYLGVDNEDRIAINDELDGNGNDWSRAEDSPFE